MLILQNAGNQKKDTEILIITPWREQHSTSFQILFYGSSSLHFPFSDWKCSAGETSVLLVWALHSRKQWLSAMKKIQWGDAVQSVRHGLAEEGTLELRPDWRLPLCNNMVSEPFRQRHKQEPRPKVGMSLTCFRNRKKDGGQWREEMMSEGREWIT